MVDELYDEQNLWNAVYIARLCMEFVEYQRFMHMIRTDIYTQYCVHLVWTNR